MIPRHEIITFIRSLNNIVLFKKINLSEAIEKKKSLKQFQLCKSLGQQQIASLLKAPTFYCMANAKECNQAFGVIKFVKKMHSKESRYLLANIGHNA